MKVADLTVEEFKALIEEVVERKLDEMLGDPDEGLVLRDEVVERLERSLASKKRGLTPEQVAAEIGLKWPASTK